MFIRTTYIGALGPVALGPVALGPVALGPVAPPGGTTVVRLGPRHRECRNAVSVMGRAIAIIGFLIKGLVCPCVLFKPFFPRNRGGPFGFESFRIRWQQSIRLRAALLLLLLLLLFLFLVLLLLRTVLLRLRAVRLRAVRLRAVRGVFAVASVAVASVAGVATFFQKVGARLATFIQKVGARLERRKKILVENVGPLVANVELQLPGQTLSGRVLRSGC